VPREFIKPIDQGVQGALELGILAGFPLVDVKVTLYDGSYHEVDSNEMAFKFAGSIAFKEAGAQGFAGAARAGDGRRGYCPRRVHGGHYR